MHPPNIQERGVLKWLLGSGDHEAAKLHLCPACPPYLSLRDVARAYVQRDPVSIARAVVPGADPAQVLAVCDVRAQKRVDFTVSARNARSVLAAICEADDACIQLDGELDAAFVMAADALLLVNPTSAVRLARVPSELALDVALKKPTRVRLSVPYKTIRNVDEFVAAQRSCARLYVLMGGECGSVQTGETAHTGAVLTARCTAGKAMAAFAAPGAVLEYECAPQPTPTFTLCAFGCEFVIRDPTVSAAVLPLHEQVDAVLDCAQGVAAGGGVVLGTLVVDRATSNRLIKDTYRLLVGKNIGLALVDVVTPKKNCAFCP